MDQDSHLAHVVGRLIGWPEEDLQSLSKALGGGEGEALGEFLKNTYVNLYDDETDKCYPFLGPHDSLKTAVAWRLSELAGLNSIERYKLARVLHRRFESTGFVLREDLGKKISKK